MYIVQGALCSCFLALLLIPSCFCAGGDQLPQSRSECVHSKLKQCSTHVWVRGLLILNSSYILSVAKLLRSSRAIRPQPTVYNYSASVVGLFPPPVATAQQTATARQHNTPSSGGVLFWVCPHTSSTVCVPVSFHNHSAACKHRSTMALSVHLPSLSGRALGLVLIFLTAIIW